MGENELVASMALIRTDSIDAAVEQVRRFGAPGGRGERRWTDGPFTESKELIAGFSILAGRRGRLGGPVRGRADGRLRRDRGRRS